MRPACLAVALCAAALLAGCGSSEPKGAAPSAAAERAALAGSPPALAALHRQASVILPGGRSAFAARLGSLRGHPVVVNAWASWCGPCRFEFPSLQQASVRLGRRVGFLGVATRDSADNARGFLRRFPVSYPSYDDDSGDLAGSLAPSGGLPFTVFVSRSGQKVYTHQGPYPSAAALETDVRRYLGA